MENLTDEVSELTALLNEGKEEKDALKAEIGRLTDQLSRLTDMLAA